MKENTRKTSISYSDKSWIGETILEEKSMFFKIFTKVKNNYIESTYNEVIPSISGGYIQKLSFSNDDVLNRTKFEGNVLRSELKEAHYKAITIFDEIINQDDFFNFKLKEGHILFLEGYGKSQFTEGNEHIIYKIENDGFKNLFLTVERTTLELKEFSFVRNIEEKFGIGVYYKKDYEYQGSKKDIENLLIDAKTKERVLRAQEKNKTKKIELDRKEKIEKGKKDFFIPTDAVCVIVADLYQNDSDTMTDYFSTSVDNTKRLFLSFSKSKRNNMNELRAACGASKITINLLENEETVESKFNNSYLPNFFIGTELWTGYKVCKLKSFDLTKQKNLEELYIARSEGRFFCKLSKRKVVNEITDNKITLIDYSEKAFVLKGDTKPIKDKLKKIGGRFNYRLKCGAGWVFSKKKRNEVLILLDSL